tara:strand:+ start:2118 stop:2327 length:210 start_codon:yes stop_codon:yes gene_type:complete
MKKSIFANAKVVKTGIDEPEIIATCNCGYSAKLSTFEYEWEQESWEMPEPYKVYICPNNTEDCCIDNFY